MRSSLRQQKEATVKKEKNGEVKIGVIRRYNLNFGMQGIFWNSFCFSQHLSLRRITLISCAYGTEPLNKIRLKKY